MTIEDWVKIGLQQGHIAPVQAAFIFMEKVNREEEKRDERP